MHRSVNETGPQNLSNSAPYPVCKRSKGMCIAKPQVAAVEVIKIYFNNTLSLFKNLLAS